MGSFDPRCKPGPIAEINVIPLVDVMLVLLVIFIITAPLLTHSVKIELPKASSTPNVTRSAHIELGIRANGEIYWNGAPVTGEEMVARFAVEARNRPQPELHIRADRLAHYESVAEVMSAASNAGLVRIGFVTDPKQP